MKVEVTIEDIAKGVRGDCDNCPVALALKRKGYPSALVGRCAIYLTPNSGAHYLSDEVSRRIGEFDRDGTMVPFEFGI